MIMTATVIRTDSGGLLVRDENGGMEVMVLTADANRFSPGDLVRITHNGQMTFSIPPQVTATSVQRISGPAGSVPSSMRAVILQVRNNSLLVRNTRNNTQFRVRFSHAHHFCARQRVVIRYNTITIGNPPEITAIDIVPEC